jgi:hypothetical protein
MQRSPYRHSKNSNFMTKRKEANRTMATALRMDVSQVLLTNH